MTTVHGRQAFNDLSFAESEGLALLAEECGETVQAIGKLLRHGAWSTHPDSPEGPNNLDNLCKELGDVLAAIDILGLKWADIEAARKKKLAKVGYYLHHGIVLSHSGERIRVMNERNGIERWVRYYDVQQAVNGEVPHA